LKEQTHKAGGTRWKGVTLQKDPRKKYVTYDPHDYIYGFAVIPSLKKTTEDHNLSHTGLNSISLMDSTCANMHWANCTFLKVWSHSRRRHHTPLNSLAVVNLVALSDHKFGGCPLNRSLSLLGSLSLSKFAYDDSFEKIILTSQAICPTRF
jgi:hypothetical protein